MTRQIFFSGLFFALDLLVLRKLDFSFFMNLEIEHVAN